MIVQDDHQPERRAQPGIETGLAGERYLRIFDREIAQIKRFAEREKADEQQPVGLLRSGKKEPRIHAPRHYAACAGPGQPWERRRTGGAAAVTALAFHLFRRDALGYDGGATGVLEDVH